MPSSFKGDKPSLVTAKYSITVLRETALAVFKICFTSVISVISVISSMLSNICLSLLRGIKICNDINILALMHKIQLVFFVLSLRPPTKKFSKSFGKVLEKFSKSFGKDWGERQQQLKTKKKKINLIAKK